MPESTELPLSDKPISTNTLRAVFVPRPMGICILLIITLACTAGTIRQELALVLTGAVFGALWAYCLVMTLALALMHSRRARRACIRVNPCEAAAGDSAEAIYSESEGAAFNGAIVQLPGILVRCRLQLASKDGRRIQYDFNPADSPPHLFTAESRGAYFAAPLISFRSAPPSGFCGKGNGDELAVFDVLGFFRFAYRLPAGNSARLLVSPHAADEPPAIHARAGESTLKPEFSIQRTDNLIDHRPYVPGDDPRRINWKLYSHGGGLFVREGEYEPPPQSNIIILVDAAYDPLLYTLPDARHGVDVLCGNALSAALACMESGMDALIGYSGGMIRREAVHAPEIAAALAWPAAVPLSAAVDLPAVPDKCGILILGLPRSSAENSAIDRFLAAHPKRPIELLFFCIGGAENASPEHGAAAEVCAGLYNQRPGVRAKVVLT